MKSFCRSHGVRLGLAALAVSLQLATPFAATSSAQSASVAASAAPNGSGPGTCPDVGPADYPVAGGWFYTEEGRGCITDAGPARRRGYLVQDDDKGAFWTEFRRFGGVAVLGYPVSQPYHYPVGSIDGYWYQAFEKGILQWQPENGRAVMANAFDQFTEQKLDDALAVLGIPAPKDNTADDNAHMSWLTEPLFMSRYFFDPVAAHSSDPDRPGFTAFTNVDQAEMFFGVPQSMPDRLALLGPQRADGTRQSLYPLTHSFMAQRFQKGGMQLFFDSGTETFTAPVWTDRPVFVDPTVVPGEARPGCVVVTAVGLLARTVGVDKVVPSAAAQALPADPGHPWVDSVVPPVPTGQIRVSFELLGSGFGPNEPVTVTVTQFVPPSANGTQSSVGQIFSKTYPPATTRADGSFEQMATDVPVGLYTITATGSGTSKDQYQSPLPLDLSVPTIPQQSATGTACTQVGLPVGN